MSLKDWWEHTICHASAAIFTAKIGIALTANQTSFTFEITITKDLFKQFDSTVFMGSLSQAFSFQP